MHKTHTKIHKTVSVHLTSWYCVQSKYGDEFWTSKLTLEVMVESFYTDARILQIASITSALEFLEVTVIKDSQPSTQNAETLNTSHSTSMKNFTFIFGTVDLSTHLNSPKHLMLGKNLVPRKRQRWKREVGKTLFRELRCMHSNTSVIRRSTRLEKKKSAAMSHGVTFNCS